MGNRAIILSFFCILLFLCGCDHLTTYKITSTIFDGVPSLPPPEQFCREYHERKKAEENEAARKQQLTEAKIVGSTHPPYAEKNCDGCHDKSKEGGLVLPKQELCFSCHPDITKGDFAHGPTSVGDCLSCHDPHSSSFPSLLKAKPDSICANCHKEERLAAGLHKNANFRGMSCLECHNPHAGASKYLLK